MEINLNDFLDAFIEEAKDNLEKLNESAIALEKNKKDKELLNQIFRISHTIKGMAGSMGYEKMRSLTHTLEDLLQDVRDDKLQVTPKLVNLLFNSHDYLEKCLNSIISTSKESDEEPTVLVEDLKKLHQNEPDTMDEVEEPKKKGKKAKKAEVEVVQEKVAAEPKEVSASSENVFDITVSISGDCRMIMPRMFIILRSIEEDGKIILSKPSYQELSSPDFNPDTYDVYARVETNVIETVLDKLNKLTEIEAINSECIYGDAQVVKEVVKTETIEHIGSSQGSIAHDVHHEIPQVQASPEQPHHKAEEYLRIAASKVDNLSDMIGELMIVESLVEQRIMDKISDDPMTSKDVVRMGRLTKDIQNLSMSLRMIPLKSTIQKVVRTGRDSAEQLHKEINIIVEGEDTEIDRTIADKLYTPLMHMVRNSIGHGIEEADQRLGRNKTAEGNITIAAYNKRGSVYMEIEDDGAGLNLEKILAKATEKGIAEKDKKYTDDEITNFIFLPGFSTASQVDSVSGRGVGMDVVRTDITKIGGSVKVETTPGMGTKFTLKIPINLAILNGTIVEIMGKLYIFPTLNIREIVNVTDDSWISIKGREKMLKVRGEVIQIYPIKDLLMYHGFEKVTGEHEERLMVIVELEGLLRAIPVKNVLERREIVVKSLGNEFKNLDFISGATILGNGVVALILDIEGLLKKNEQDLISG